MASYLFSVPQTVDQSEDATLMVEGWHKPGSLTLSSGAWIQAAGSASLQAGGHPLLSHDQYVWLLVEEGAVRLSWEDTELALAENDCCFLPAGQHEASLLVEQSATVIWLALEGPLSAMVVRKMGALLHIPLRHTCLPSQMYLARQIVQVIVRHSGTSNATYQLQHLMYGMLASHWGQPVAMDAMLSHEIAKVVDTLRAGQYKDNLSLARMAAISRMPMETFRKRFVAEVGMPPLSYVLRCKMERAKELLREQNCTVRQVGIEVGMSDPYHFSKQFKNIVGISPSAFMKQAAMPEATIRGSERARAEEKKASRKKTADSPGRTRGRPKKQQDGEREKEE
ncbi:MAG: AraC family transcriptional regulator [Clostridia bacterium]|nr:AraC family transcriptional regulator [Clostridia bacterium]